MLRAVDLLRHEFTEPAEDRLGFGDQGYFLQSLASQPSADLGQRGALLIREAQPTWRMCPEDPVLRDKVFNLKQQLLIDQPGHVRQQTGHLVTFHQSASSQVVDSKPSREFLDPTGVRAAHRANEAAYFFGYF
jgi:hypothetical protein